MATAFKRQFILLATALVAFAETGLGQSAVHWSFYRTADGLAEPVYTSISFTPQGKLIAANSATRFASELDGYSISNFPAPVGYAGRISESPGGQLWAFAPGKLLEFKNGAWLSHSASEISGIFQTTSAFLPVRQGCVIVLLPDCLMEFSAEDPAHPQTTRIEVAAQMHIGDFIGLAPASDGGLWICGSRGVAQTTTPARNVNLKTSWQEYLPPESWRLKDFSAPEPDADGGITFIAESIVTHQKMAVTFDGHQWALKPSAEKIFRAWRGPNHNFWAATSDSLFQWNEARTNWVADDEVSVGRIFDVAVEPSGAFWLATSAGLVRGSAAVWQKPEAARDLNSPIQCLTVDSQNRIYYIADDTLHLLENGQNRMFPLSPPPQPATPNYALFPLKDGSLLVQKGQALLHFQPLSGSFKPLPGNHGQRVALGTLPDGSVCLFNPSTDSHFEEFDGTHIRPLSGAPTLDAPVSGLNTLFTARNGDLWMGGESQGLWRSGDQWHSLTSKDQTGPQMAVGFVELTDGTIWCATRDEIWEFNGGKNWLLLQYGFNHINGLIQSHDGSVWIASNSGLFRFYKDAWLENGADEGLPNGPIYAICEDQRGQIWAATSRGLSVFHPEAVPDPPQTIVHQLVVQDRQLSEGGTLDLILEGQAKWKSTPPERLLYSYQLDQSGWSPFRGTTILSFPDLTAGRHYFQVRAMNPGGDVDPTPAMLDFNVALPWFREIRLWVVLSLGLGIAIFFAAVAWNRHRRLVQSYAAVERKVAERTRELEIATRELLHSQKMNALGTLTAGIAHDFNNILSIIKGSAQIIEDNPGQPEKIRTRVDRIKTVVQQGAEIVDALLGFSRGSDAPPVPCDLNTVVADTIKLLGDRFLRETKVKFERAQPLPEIVAPRQFIQQILLNFIFNAAEAMNSHKEITLATSVTGQLPSNVFLAPSLSPSFVLVSVRDLGSGIAPEIMPRIFEPFFTTKALSARRGTGLGLSMVYELAKKMDAGLAVQSAIGRGSTFTLIFPVSKNSGAGGAPENTQ